jgi:hypothetical protein
MLEKLPGVAGRDGSPCRSVVEHCRVGLLARRCEIIYTLRTIQTMRAMSMIVPRMPPIYIGISLKKQS